MFHAVYTATATLINAREAVALVALRARDVEVEALGEGRVRITGRRAKVIATLDSRLLDSTHSVITRA